MGLKAMPIGRRLAVITNGDRQEVILNIGIVDTRFGAHKGGAFKLVGGAKTGFEEQPLSADHRLGKQIQLRIERNRLGAGLLDIQFQMILQIAANAWTVGQNLDSVFAQMFSRPNPRQHQHFWRVDGRGCKDHLFARPHPFDVVAALDFNANRLVSLKHHTTGKTAHHAQVVALQRWLQIGIGGRPAAAFVYGLLHRPEAFLLQAVVIVGDLKTCLTACLNKGMEERIVARSTPDMQRPIGAAPLALCPTMTGFGALEIGLHIGIGPAGSTALIPMIEVFCMTAHIDHAVDRRRPTDHLATRCRQLAVVQIGFRLGAKSPIIARHVHWIRKRRGHLDEGTDIGTAIFQNQNGMLAVF